jgi:outer membrane lipoprotein
MKRLAGIALILLVLAACSPALDRSLMEQGAREFRLSHLTETPEVFKDHLFILGGVIIETRLVAEGSQVEALYVPVDRYGNLGGSSTYEGRFIALLPRAKGLLDPMIYKKGREITIAGDFTGVRKGKIDEMEYLYPVFEIRQLHLWEERRDYYWPYGYGYPYYYPTYWYPWCSDPWGRPYHCGPYGGPYPW